MVKRDWGISELKYKTNLDEQNYFANSWIYNTSIAAEDQYFPNACEYFGKIRCLIFVQNISKNTIEQYLKMCSHLF